MATAESQAEWRRRKAAGLIQHCKLCDRRLRSDNCSGDMCHTCWKRSDEGKAHLALAQRLRRLKINEIEN